MVGRAHGGRLGLPRGLTRTTSSCGGRVVGVSDGGFGLSPSAPAKTATSSERATGQDRCTRACRRARWPTRARWEPESLTYSSLRIYGSRMDTTTRATTTIERTVAASPARVWELWTTPEGISRWWAPDGFRTDVTQLDLEPGGELVYTMTAVGAEQVAFMEQSGMPLATQSRKRFTEVVAATRLAYHSLVDFVPDHEPYEQLTIVELQPDGDGTRVTMHVEAMHDDVWTQRLLDGRGNEIENLAKLVEGD